MQIADDNLLKLLRNAKNDPRDMLEIITQFKPLLASYGRKNGWRLDQEDMESVLVIRLIELIKEMDIPDEPGAAVKYIAFGIKCHFLNVVKKLNKIADSECSAEFVEQSSHYDTCDIGFDSMIEDLDSRKQEVLRLKFKEMLTDKEIADKLGISRQAVNKQLRQAYKELIPSL